MALTSGGSHASSALLTVVLGAVLSEYVELYAAPVTNLIGRQVGSRLGVEVPVFLVGVAVVATTLSFIWGVVYHLVRH